MSINIHPSAVVEEGVTLSDNVTIGPYCVVGNDVTLGEGVTLVSHVTVSGNTSIGANTTVYPFAALGFPPQSLKYKGEPSDLVIGENNVIREHVTIHPGTEHGTRIGNDGLFMVACHVGHDCEIGNNVIMCNNAPLGGHVIVGDHVYIGGLSAVHQFVRIGQQAIIGGMSGVENDVIPYGSVMGERARLSGLNIVGLKRRGFSREMIHALRSAYRLLFANEGTMAERIADVSDHFKDQEAVADIILFMKSDASRAYCLPKELK